MSLVGNLIGFSLRQTLGVDTNEIIQSIERRFTDHSQALPLALARANERAWQALAVALAGDGLFELKGLLAPAEEKSFHDQVRDFLADSPIRHDGAPADFHKKCLAELNQARQAGLLAPRGLNARQVAQFNRYADPTALVNGAWHAVVRFAEDLKPHCPNLAALIGQRPPAGPPLLIAAFAYFFRREVETNTELAHGLFFDGLRQLSANQEKGFAQVGLTLVALGSRFDAVMEQLGHIGSIVVATHGAVLDMQAELERLGELHSANAEEMRQLMAASMAQLAKVGMQAGEVRPQHSFSIRGEDERQAVKQLLARFRQLPEDQQRQVPALLNGLGKLQVGAGDFDGAKQTFMEVAHGVSDGAARAEAHFNTYRAALEKNQWDEALAAIRQAVALDEARFAPFPLHRYVPKRLLGAGGFGTVFLCHDRNFGEDVAIKTLYGAEMDRTTANVFQEAKALRQLSHPAIIRIRDCDFMDAAARSRPYLVMDYFPGETLEALVSQRGVFSPADLIGVAEQVAAAMKAAHDQNILHRDLKPGNVLVRKKDSRWLVKIIDFGLALAKQASNTAAAARTAGDSVLGKSIAGTLKYAPPEQLGELPGVGPGQYSDVYSFGKLCCYALFETTEPKRRHWASLPGTLPELLESCLERQPGDRPANFTEIRTRLLVLQATCGDHKLRELRPDKEEEYGEPEDNAPHDQEREGQEAMQSYHKAAEQGDVFSQNCLGVMYAEGRGVAKDDVQSVQWYRKAAEQGNAYAQCNLAWMYENGRGIAKDEAQAAYWYYKAAEKGNALAQEKLNELRPETSHALSAAWRSAGDRLPLREGAYGEPSLGWRGRAWDFCTAAWRSAGDRLTLREGAYGEPSLGWRGRAWDFCTDVLRVLGCVLGGLLLLWIIWCLISGKLTWPYR